MNERILDLALNASVEYIASPVWAFTDAELKKFARLIVQECLVQIDEAIPDTTCAASGAYRTAKLAAQSRVKKYFGLDE